MGPGHRPFPLRAGKHVSCQKPAAGSVADIRRMADAADRASALYRSSDTAQWVHPTTL